MAVRSHLKDVKKLVQSNMGVIHPKPIKDYSAFCSQFLVLRRAALMLERRSGERLKPL